MRAPDGLLAPIAARRRSAAVALGAPAQLRLDLQRAVESALLLLGQGFLAHAENAELRAELAVSRAAGEYFDELSRLVYRLIFLISIEERALLHPPGCGARATERYARERSLTRLRSRALGEQADPAREGLWEQLKQIFLGLTRGEPELGLPALGGIFAARHCRRLQGAKLGDAELLGALREIAGWRSSSETDRASWGSLAPEEIGSVYEALLGLAPELSSDASEFRIVTKARADNARRATGGYYTPDRLVQVVLDGSLEPAIAQAIARDPDQPELALRELRVVDPACGAGHFLLAAARRLASHLARSTAPGEACDADYQRAFSQVVQSAIYGVDLNPLAVELCRLSLWLETAEPGLAFAVFESRVRVGNSLLGARSEQLAAGIPDRAWKPLPGDERKVAARLRRRNHVARSSPSVLPLATPKLVADAWCASFFWPKQTGELGEAAPTEEVWRKLGEPVAVPALTLSTIAELACKYHFFHWQLEFEEVFARGGFDVALGNPPWIAHAGRAAQPLPPPLKHFFECNYEAFADYPTTHGMFVSVAAGILRPGGYLGLVIPSSLSELGGYAPTRRAHDRRCDFPGDLIDFGESQFEGVTQPCMALVSQCALAGRSDQDPGAPWPMQRNDLDATARALIAKLGRFPTLPPDLFGERGLQSDRQLAQHFSSAPAPDGRFATPIREGTDVREFELRPPRLHVDSAALGQRIRGPEEFLAVRAVVRQTARYPIAALSDGMAFRNSLLAVFERPGLPAAALVALLNSALLRWFHYVRFRDARQPILPQVKIGHLRALPEPPRWSPDASGTLAVLGARLSDRAGAIRRADREALDAHVFDLYELEAEERGLVSAWHEQLGPKRQSAAD